MVARSFQALRSVLLTVVGMGDSLCIAVLGVVARDGILIVIANSVEIWYTLSAALLHSGNRGEVNALEILANILVAVGANVIGYLICKWLDRHSKGQ